MEKQVVLKMDSSSNELVMLSIQSMISSIDTLLKTTSKDDFSPKIIGKIKELESYMKLESSTKVLTGEKARKMIQKLADFTNTKSIDDIKMLSLDNNPPIVKEKEKSKEEKELIQTVKQTEVEIKLLGLSDKSVEKLKAKGFIKTDNVLDLVDKIYYEYPIEMEEVVIELLMLIERVHPDAFCKYIQSMDETGDNLLMDTGIVKLEKMALYLLSKDKFDLNQQNNHGYTFLMYVCKNGWNYIFDRILPYVDIQIKNEHKETALHYTIESKNQYMCEKLIQKMKDEDLFELSSYQNNALFTVVRGGFEDLSLSILKRAPLTLLMINKQNDTILHLASRHECKKLLNEILENHFEKFDEELINLQNINGFTALDIMLQKNFKNEYTKIILSGKLNDVIYDIYSSSKTKMYDQSFIGQMILKKKDISLIEHCIKTISYTRPDRFEWLYYFCMLTASYQMKSVFHLFFDMLKESMKIPSFRTNTYPKSLFMVLIEMDWYEYVEIILENEYLIEYISQLSKEEKKTALYYECIKEKKRRNVIFKLLKMTNLAYYPKFDGIEHLQECKKLILYMHDKPLNKLFEEKMRELDIFKKEIKKDMNQILDKPSTSKYLFHDISDSHFEERVVDRQCTFTPRLYKCEIFY